MDHLSLGTTYITNPFPLGIGDNQMKSGLAFFPLFFFFCDPLFFFKLFFFFFNDPLNIEIQGEREMGKRERGKEIERDEQKRKRPRDGERFV